MLSNSEINFYLILFYQKIFMIFYFRFVVDDLIIIQCSHMLCCFFIVIWVRCTAVDIVSSSGTLYLPVGTCLLIKS